ncbi:MAG: hypothetical protein PWQ67_862 [Clostridia bacterium]|jgi:hypothetical protein|nr:hypothetical protein [Clostridia bacterium]MDN5322408.1 hypothetical protein [Clostridia bacterium]
MPEFNESRPYKGENNTNENLENNLEEIDSLGEETIEESETSYITKSEWEDHRPVNPLDQMVLGIKNFVINLPKFLFPAPPPNSPNKPVKILLKPPISPGKKPGPILPKFPVIPSKKPDVFLPKPASKTITAPVGLGGYSGIFNNFWFVTLLQVIIILFFILWLFSFTRPYKF